MTDSTQGNNPSGAIWRFTLDFTLASQLLTHADTQGTLAEGVFSLQSPQWTLIPAIINLK